MYRELRKRKWQEFKLHAECCLLANTVKRRKNGDIPITTIDELLFEFMDLVKSLWAIDCYTENVEAASGVLEKASSLLNQLILLIDDTTLKQDAKTIRIKLMQQTVLICCRHSAFDFAQTVFDRVWSKTSNKEEKEMAEVIHSLIKCGGSISDRHTNDRSYESFMEYLMPFLQKLNESMDKNHETEESHDVSSANEPGVPSTGIRIPGSRLKELSDRFGVKPVGNSGFISGDCYVDLLKAVDQIRIKQDSFLERPPRLNQVTHEVAVVTNEDLASKSHLSPIKSPVLSADSAEDLSELEDDSETNFNKSLMSRVDPTRHVREIFETRTRAQPKTVRIIKRMPRVRWSAEEEMNLYKAVQRYGDKKWALLIEKGLFDGRSNVDLKDKWRWMKKNNRLEELAKLCEPVKRKVEHLSYSSSSESECD